MAVFKCKMCGGPLDISGDDSIITCEYCDTIQTLPTFDNEKKINLFNRANRLRLNNEFDKAAGIYENIIAEFPDDAEAYWGLCLCNYGIEYVDDPSTARKIPTCHRASFEKLSADENFALALEYADISAQKVYRDEAREIDRIMDEFLSISKNEDPYDVFICYKETADSGARTIDSVLAQDVYDSLTAKGMKVFFARITLEDKLGQMYEPYIFAALNSAKVFLSIGTKYEHFHAVWVKNEWSRFLKLMAKDKSKVLIPCYKDMDAYDMPDEFKMLQAQDMGKIGFMQDLVRGVEKIIGNKPKEFVATNDTASVNVTPLLKRVFMFLEDGEWNSADSYCEKILDIDPENGYAYLGKLMVELNIKNPRYLSDYEENFEHSNNYQKAMRFADDKLKVILSNALTDVKNKISEKHYIYAKEKLEKAKKEKDYDRARRAFEDLGDYKDSAAFAQKCVDISRSLFSEEKYQKATMILKHAMLINEISEGIQILESLGDYKDSLKIKSEKEEYLRQSKESAMKIWDDYLIIKKKTDSLIKQIDEKSAPVEKMKKDIAKDEEKIGQIRYHLQQITSSQEQLKLIQQQLLQANNEINSLGVFSFYKKKELTEEIEKLTALSNSYTSEIAKSKRFLSSVSSMESLRTSVANSKKQISERLESMELLNNELVILRPQLTEITKELENKQVIEVLVQNSEILPILTDEYSIVQIIKGDNRLKSIIELSGFKILLPHNRQKLIFGEKNSLDVEAVYFQACQAMDFAKSIDDIKWARDELSVIGLYKDSASLIEKCNEMIAKNRYKM